MSFLLVPNILIHDAFGKLLFCLFDVLTSFLIHRIQRKSGLEPETCRSSTFLWLYNPLPIVISTRGSSESIVTFLVVLCVWLAGQPIPMGLIFGLAVHFKIYPCIYALSFYFAMSPESSLELKSSSSIWSRLSSSLWSRSSTYCTDIETKSSVDSVHSLRLRSTTDSNEAETQSPVSPIHSQPRLSMGCNSCKDSATRTLMEPIYSMWLLLRPSRPKAIFVAMSAIGFLLPTLTSWFLYKEDYLQEALLYHLTRKDIRHNFSPFFYPLYLLESHQDPRLSTILSSCGFLLQGALVALVSFSFPGPSKLPACMFLQTAIFVSLNKVCTSQYFVWYLCLLPLAYPLIQKHRGKALGLFIVWAMAQGLWLACAYYLEFEGKNTFLFVFVATLLFFLINVYLVCAFIKCLKMSCAEKKSDEIKKD